MLGVAGHPSEQLERGTKSSSRSNEASDTPRRRRRPARERAGNGGGEYQRPDQVRAAAFVLLRRRPTALVAPDRHVLGAVIGGQLTAAQREDGRGQGGERGESLAKPRAHRRAADRRRGERSRAHGDHDRWPRKGELGPRESSLHNREQRERLDDPNRASDERRRNLRR